MNRSYFALFVALLIHLLLLILFWFLGTIAPEFKKVQKPHEKRIKVSLKEMPKKTIDDEGELKKIQKPKKQEIIAPPMPKGNQLKEIEKQIKKPPIKYEPKKIKKLQETQEKEEIKKQPINIEKVENAEPIPKQKIKPVPPEKPYIPFTLPPVEKKEIKEEKKPKKEGFDWLYEDRSKEETKNDTKRDVGSSVGNSNPRELYGDEFGKLTPGEQKYLLDNQEIMRRITQEVLNRVAKVNLSGDINVNRVNIIEFYLHPNGDMSDFKFLKKSGYYILDNTTKETIEYAYSRYPRPSEKILIRYNVYYNLARH